MFSDEKHLSIDSANVHRPSPAASVSFGNVEGAERNGEGSSRDGSRASAELWREKRESWKERLLTPDRPERKSEESNGGSGQGSGKRFRRSGGGGGFLREDVFGHGSPKSRAGSERSEGKKRVGDGTLQVDKRRFVGGRPSADSHRSSPLSREVSRSRSQQMNDQEQRTPSQQATMDPAQLVQMALSLSESRRRQASNSQPLPIAASRNRQVSGPGDRLNTARSRGSGRQRASMPAFDSSPRVSSQYDERPSTEPAEDPAENIVYTFTPATLARAEKARKYFELANEHRRFLQYLPPLKPDADSSGNYTFESRSSPGFAQPDIRRVRSNTVSKHELGRPYNPLQTLRNRRLRHRERRPFPVSPEQFQDLPEVVDWLDEVEKAAGRPDYRGTLDVVHVPRFGKEQNNENSPASGRPKGHQRTGTASSVIARPENDWSVDPAERLADTYWVEQGDNKVLIENRRNQRLFPERNAESRKSADLDRHGSQVDGFIDENALEEEPPKKHHPRLSLPRHIPGRNKLSHLGRTASMSSLSSTEERKPDPLLVGPDRENTGPLQRQMDKLISKDKNGSLESPEIVSPDYWDSENMPFPTRETRLQDKKRGSGSMEYANGYLSGGSTQGHQRSKSADGRVSQLLEGERIRSSFDSTPPMSPIAERFVPSMSIDLSPPSAKQSKQKRRILPIFRSKSKERNTTEGRDFAAMPDDDRSRDNTPTIDPARLSVDSARPSAIKRHGTADSVASSLHRSHTQRTSDGSIKEPGSAVGRFFRGRRIGNLMRNESSRFSDKRRGKNGEGPMLDASALPSDASDTEGSADEYGGKKSMGDSEASPRTSFDSSRGKPRSHIPNLPTFTSTAAKEKPALLTPVISQEESDPISRQAAAQRETNRSPRIQRLLPPRINLPESGDAVNSDLPSQKSDSYLAHSRRKSYGFLQANGQQDSARSSRVSLGEPGKIGYKDHMPVSGLAKINAGDKKRHWSISDRQPERPPQQDQRVSDRGVARARALLLASGIKAQSLIHRANAPASPPPKYLLEACKFTSREAPSAPLRESHVTAANILTLDLDRTLHALGDGPSKYHSTIGPRLHTRLNDLKALATDKLTATVHNSSDEAEAFTIQLTSEQTLRVKQVDDAVDEMLRLRRRQFRILRRAGFKVLEWMVLSLMWGVWFVVVCYNTMRRLIVGVWKLLRWLLWW